MNQKSSLIQNNIFLTDNYSTKKTPILDNYKNNNNYDIINHITNRNNQQDEINSQTGRLKYYFKYILQLFQSKINTNNGITYYTLISKMKNKQDKILINQFHLKILKLVFKNQIFLLGIILYNIFIVL